MSATENPDRMEPSSGLALGVSGSTNCVAGTETVTEMEGFEGSGKGVDTVSTQLGGERLEGDLESVNRVENLELGLENLGQRVEAKGAIEPLPVKDVEGQEGCVVGGENVRVVEEEVISVINVGCSSCAGNEKGISGQGDDAQRVTDASDPTQDTNMRPNVSAMVTAEELENRTMEGSLEVRTGDSRETKIDDRVSEVKVTLANDFGHDEASGDVSVVATSEIDEDVYDVEVTHADSVGHKAIGNVSVVVTSKILGIQSIEENLESKTKDNQSPSLDLSTGTEGNSKSEDEVGIEGTKVKRGGKMKRKGKENGKVALAKPFVSDIVWGKVRSHPWWPGLIFDPSAATKKAKKYYKKGRFLIAYFGDQSFAWNEESLIKPFSVNFSQMEKQSNSEDFHHAIDCALDEVSRRVEFGLACSCLPEEIVTSIKSQVIVNPGIEEESSRIDGGDESFGAESFEPAKLIQYIKALAMSPNCIVDRLEHAVSQAQMLAVHRSKGYSQLPEVRILGRLLEEDEEILLPENVEHSDKIKEDEVLVVKDEKQVPSEKVKPKSEDSSKRKRKQVSGHDTNSRGKEKTLSELMPSKKSKAVDSIPDGDNVSKKEVGVKLISSCSSKKRKAVDSIPDDSAAKPSSSNGDNVSKKEVDAKKPKIVDSTPDDSVKPSSSNGDSVSKKLILYTSKKKRRAIYSILEDSATKLKKNDLPTSAGNKPKQTFRVGESILRVASQLNGANPILKYRDESVLNKKSKGKPSKGSAVSASSPKNSEESVHTSKGKHSKGRSVSASSPKNSEESPNTSKRKPSKGSAVSASSPMNSEDSPNTKFIPTEYCAPGEMLSRLWLAAKDPKKGYSFTVSVLSFFSEFRSSVCIDPAEFSKLSEDDEGSQLEYLSSRTVQSHPNESGGAQVSETVDPVNHSDENYEEEPAPTALILNFTDHDSIPSITNLNRIYSQFGTLNESRTEVLAKSSRAKVVFERRSDAETAFSSAGKYGIFGTSLVSYSLKYMPSTPSKASFHAKKQSKKDSTSEKGNAT